jgi:MoaA/NifB/PqqE/SkfB family radical SAM enzyme
MDVEISIKWKRRARALSRRSRELMMIAKGIASTDHPVLAQVIPTRRCNLSCKYCNEYDKTSQPVPTAVMLRRIDQLAALGTTAVTFSGGEPLLHPELEALAAHVRQRGMIAGLITNGYLLTTERIENLNRAGLDHLQISIDNVTPDDISKKSLKVLDRKLQLLAQSALFAVNINSVVGAGVIDPQDALTIANTAQGYGFSSTVGIIHDGGGQLRPLSAEEYSAFRKIKSLKKTGYAQLNYFQENIAKGKPNDWQCRAGARYLYICEDGLVHYCSQQRGFPGIPLEHYDVRHIRRAFLAEKSCAPNCTVSCVHQVSYMDFWRAPQTRPVVQPQTVPALVQIQVQIDGD